MSSPPLSPATISTPPLSPVRSDFSSVSSSVVPPHAHAHGRCPVTGADAETHAYCPGQKGDSRSPCPALNTLANHGYLPRDGKCITPSVLIHALREGYHLSYPLAWFLTHGGFYLLGQRRKRICLHDLSRHNCIEHNASLVHPDVEHRDEYAPIEMHLHMLEDLLRFSKDGVIMTPDDIARVRVVREAQYAIPMDKVHAEIARGEMAIVLQLFNNPDPSSAVSPAPAPPTLTSKLRNILAPKPAAALPVPAPLPGVPNDMLRVFFHEERLPDGWTPYHRVGLLHTIRMATRLRKSMSVLERQLSKSRAGTRTNTLDGAVAALVPALTIATPERQATGMVNVIADAGEVGVDMLPEGDGSLPAAAENMSADASSPTTRQGTVGSSVSSEMLRTPVDTPLPTPASVSAGFRVPAAGNGGVGKAAESVYPDPEEEGVLERIREMSRMIQVAE